ncbi:hypothetical protein, partial [Ruminococcus albus]|uniref:hypothetical protein n=1 Tax=Ruminococcus albus TaxID=1264 RepID=UPI001A98BFAE
MDFELWQRLVFSSSSAKGADYITAVTGRDKHFFQLNKLLLVLYRGYFGTELLNIICCIVKENLARTSRIC